MSQKEQDKRWNELGEEKQKSARLMYKHLTTILGLSKSNAQTQANEMMLFALKTTFGTHNLLPKLTYEDVEKELFDTGIDEKQIYAFIPFLRGNDKWREKLEAIGKLLVVAKFLNKNVDGTDWAPDWEKVQEDEERIYGIGIDPPNNNEVSVFQVNNERIFTEIVYFRTDEIAQQAIEILGEETIRAALGNY